MYTQFKNRNILKSRKELEDKTKKFKRLLFFSILGIGSLFLLKNKKLILNKKQKGETNKIISGKQCTFDEKTLGSEIFAKLGPVLNKELLLFSDCSEKKISPTQTKYTGTLEFLEETWEAEAFLNFTNQRPTNFSFGSKRKSFGFKFPNIFSPCFLGNILKSQVPVLNKLDLCGGKINVRSFSFDSDSGSLDVVGSSKVFGVLKLLSRHVVGYENLTDAEKKELEAGEAGEDVFAKQKTNAAKLTVQVKGVLRPFFRLTYTLSASFDFGHVLVYLPSVHIDSEKKEGFLNALFLFNFGSPLEEAATKTLDAAIHDRLSLDVLRSLTGDDGSLDTATLASYLPDLPKDMLALSLYLSLLDKKLTFYGSLVKRFELETKGLTFVVSQARLKFFFDIQSKEGASSPNKMKGAFLAEASVNNISFLAEVNVNPDDNQPLLFALVANSALRECLATNLFEENKTCLDTVQNANLKDLDKKNLLPDVAGFLVLFLAKNNFEVEVPTLEKKFVFENVEGLTLAFHFEVRKSNSKKVNSLLAKQKEDFSLVLNGVLSSKVVYVAGKLEDFQLSEKVLLKEVSLLVQNQSPFLGFTCKLRVLRDAVDKEDREFSAAAEVGTGYWFVKGHFETRWELPFLESVSAELREVDVFVSKAEDPSSLPVEYTESFKNNFGEETANSDDKMGLDVSPQSAAVCGGLTALVKAKLLLAEKTYEAYVLFSKCSGVYCVSFYGRKNGTGAEDPDTLSDFTDSVNSSVVLNKLQDLLPTSVAKDLFSKPVKNLKFELKLGCFALLFRVTLTSLTLGEITFVAELRKVLENERNADFEVDAEKNSVNKLYRISDDEPNQDGYVFVLLVVPEIDFTLESSPLFEKVPKLKIAPPTLVVSNKMLEVAVPMRTKETTEDGETTVKVDFVKFRAKAGLSLFSRAEVEANPDLKFVSAFQENEEAATSSLTDTEEKQTLTLAAFVGPTGVYFEGELKGSWEPTEEVLLIDAKLSLGAKKDENGWKAFLHFETAGVVSVLERKTLGFGVAEFSTKGIALQAKVCRMVEASKGLRAFTTEEVAACKKSLKEATEKETNNDEEKEEVDYIEIDIGRGKKIRLSKLQVDLRLGFGKGKEEKKAGFYLGVLGMAEMKSFELVASLSVGSSFALVLEFYSTSDAFVGLGTAFDELSSGQSLDALESPSEVQTALNEKFAFKYFKAQLTASKDEVKVLVKGDLCVFVRKYGAMNRFAIDIEIDDQATEEDASSYTFQVTNLEHPEAPPVEFLEAVADLLGADKFVTGAQSKPHLLEVEGVVDSLGEPVKLSLNRGFYALMVFDAQTSKAKTVSAKSGLGSVVVAGVFKSVSEFRLSLFLNAAFRAGSVKFTFASIFLERVPVGFGVGFTVTVEFPVERATLVLLGELGMYLVGGQPGVKLKVAMLTDWEKPFGLNGVTVLKTTLAIMLNPTNFNPLEFLLDSGLKIYTLAARFTLYWNTANPADLQFVFRFRVANFDFGQLMGMAFEGAADALSSLPVRFELLVVQVVSSTSRPTVSVPDLGETFDVGFLLNCQKFNFFNFLVGSVYIKVSAKGFVAKGQLKPFEVPGLLRVSGLEADEDLRFDIVTVPTKFRFYFEGRVYFIGIDATLFADITETQFRFYLLVDIEFFEVEIAVLCVLQDDIRHVKRFFVFLEFLDYSFGNDRREQSLYYALRHRRKQMSLLESVNERKEGNATDAQIRKSEGYGDDVKAQRTTETDKKERKYNDKKESGQALVLDKRTTSDKRTALVRKTVALRRKLEVAERAVCEELAKFRQRNDESVRNGKEDVDALRLALAKTENKLERTNQFGRAQEVQLWFWDAIVNFFKRLLNALKRAFEAALALLNKIVELVKELVKLIVRLLKSIFTIYYLLGYAKVEREEAKGVAVQAHVDLLFFRTYHVTFCCSFSLGDVQPLEKNVGETAKENSSGVGATKEKVDRERKARLVDGEELERRREEERKNKEIKDLNDVDVCAKHSF